VSNVPVALVVIPCHNEEQRLDVAAFKAFTREQSGISFVFVDDGSKDGTRGVIEALVRHAPSRFQLVALDVNQGKAEAVRQGIVAAVDRNPDYVGFWDADLSTPLDEIGEFVAHMEEKPEVDIVYGARVMVMGRTIERSPFRHYAGRVYATAASNVLDLPVYDTQCGAKLFRVTDTMRKVFSERFIVNWTFDVEILARYITTHPEGDAYVRRALYELPLRRWVEVAGSKVRPSDFGRGLRDLWRIHNRYLRKRS
jgi:glycosyltransferase involved in cell wall biosynthesis